MRRLCSCCHHSVILILYSIGTETFIHCQSLAVNNLFMRIQSYINTVLGGLLLIATTAIHAVNITGAGASLPYPVYAKWAAEYHQATHKQVKYQSIGSGGDRKS